MQDPVPQAQIVVDTDEIDALLRPGGKHAVEQVDRLKGGIAEADAASAARLDFVERITLVEHVSAAAAAVEVVAADCIAVFDAECADMSIGNKAQCAEAELVDVFQGPA